jgi:hypothetical protein
LNSGYEEGTRIVAVVEEKLFRRLELNSYHARNNSILAQIMTSMIGSGARIGLVLANGMFKCFWIVNEPSQMFTYPIGNDFASVDQPDDRLLLTKVLFHIVRCSIRTNFKRKNEAEPRYTKKSRPTELDSHKAIDNTSQLIKHAPPPYKAVNDTGEYTRLSCMNGSFILVKPFNMNLLSEDEREAFNRREQRDREIARNNFQYRTQLEA